MYIDALIIIYQISSTSVDIAQALGTVNLLFFETQPKPISILPLDLKGSVYILSTMLTLLNTNLQQGGSTEVLNTTVSFFPVHVLLHVFIFLQF